VATKKQKPKSKAKKASAAPRRKAKPARRAAPRAAAARKPAPKTAKPAPTKGRVVGARERPPSRPEQRPAFIADARRASDELAEELGEGFVLGVTSGEDTEELYERERPEEEGGPFVETSGKTEFAYGTDESNPEDAEPAPWPAVSPGQPPPHKSGGPR
jgi:hypothetical protein